MSNSLEGRTVVITGAAGGFGRVLTEAFAAAGARVHASDVSPDGLNALQEALAQAGLSNNVTTRLLDISDRSQCNEAISAAGAVDILINNGAIGMGVISPTHMTDLVSIEEIEPEIWDKFIAVNLTGGWNLTRAVIPSMKSRGWGRIINVTTSMFTMLRGRFHPYGPAKAGFEAMSAGHATEFEPYGITVNVVVPGGASDTPMVPDESGFDRGTLIPPTAMVAPMLWLCSDDASKVTGKRYIAADWDTTKSIDENRRQAEAPIGWPDLAGNPVWPGGKPDQ